MARAARIRVENPIYGIGARYDALPRAVKESCKRKIPTGRVRIHPGAKNARGSSALPGLEAALCLVDDVELSAPADEAIVAMARAQGFKRISDLHGGTRRNSCRDDFPGGKREITRRGFAQPAIFSSPRSGVAETYCSAAGKSTLRIQGPRKGLQPPRRARHAFWPIAGFKELVCPPIDRSLAYSPPRRLE